MLKLLNFVLINSYYTFKANNSEFTPLYYFIFKIINPMLQLSFFFYLHKFVRNDNEITPYLIANILILSVSSAIYSLARIVTYEREYGTLKLLEISSCNKFILYTSRSLFYIIDSIFSFFVGVIFSIIFFKLKINLFLFAQLFLINLVANFSLMGFGILIGSIGLALRNVLLLTNSFYLVVVTFSGANFSLNNLPYYLRIFSKILPLSYGIQAAKLLIFSNFFDFRLILNEFIIGIVFYLGSFYLFRYFNKIAKKSGNMDFY